MVELIANLQKGVQFFAIIRGAWPAHSEEHQAQDVDGQQIMGLSEPVSRGAEAEGDGVIEFGAGTVLGKMIGKVYPWDPPNTQQPHFDL